MMSLFRIGISNAGLDPLHAAVRNSDPETSKAAAVATPKTKRSQAGKLLLVFDAALPPHHSGRLGDIALNSYEASVRAGLPTRACYWKRVSDLKYLGLIQKIGTNLDPVTRAERETYIITDAGRDLAKELKRGAK